MRRVLTVSPGQMEVVDSPEPELAPGEALVAVAAVGLCGSDFHLFSGHHPYARYPNTQGHESSGAVVSLPAGYAGTLAVGDSVAVEPLRWCGACFACRRGRVNCCSRLQVMGAHVPGALADRVAVPAGSLYPLGDLDQLTGALVEPMSIGLQAVARSGVVAGDKVVVIGAGPIGLAVTLGCHDLGADVLVVDRVAARLAHAGALGAAATVDTTSEDLAARVAAWTDGEGAASVIDATGVPAMIRQAVDLVAASGVIVVVGISDQEVSIPVIEFSRKEISILGSRNNAGLFGDAVDLVRRHAAAVRGILTHTFDVERTPEAMAFAMANPAEVEKLVITFAPTRAAANGSTMEATPVRGAAT